MDKDGHRTQWGAPEISFCPACGFIPSKCACRVSPNYGRNWQRRFRNTAEGQRHVRAMNLKKYGLTPESYDLLLDEQGGVCKACHQVETGRNQFGPLKLAVDHDHSTGKVRGLLCMRCNRALGLLGDSAERIYQLFLYRKDH